MCGGTGDRLGGILQALFMAVCTDRLFFIDWQDPSPLDRFLEPNLLMWNASRDVFDATYSDDDATWTLNAMDDYQNPVLLDPGAMPTDPTCIVIRTNVWTGQAHRSACMRSYTSRFGPNAGDVFGPESDASQDHYYFRVGFEALFRWSGAVLEHTERVRERLHLPHLSSSSSSSSPPTVAIHLRTGLGETFRDLVLPTAEEDVWPLYYQCAKRVQRALAERCGLPPPPPSSGDVSISSGSSISTGIVPVYLAADSTAVLRHFAAYGDPALRFVNGTAVYHLDRTDRAQLGKNPEEAELQVWTDLQLLVESTCLVYTDKSKFSRLGRWLHRRPPSSSSASHPSGRRCAFTFNQCRDQDVQRAVAALDHEDAC